MPEYTIRPIRADEWREVRALRLAGLADPAAPLAFTETLDDGLAKTDEFWQARAAGSSSDGGGEHAGTRQFVAIAGDGTWVGTVVVLRERAGDTDFLGAVIPEDGRQLVGVYVDAAHRGAGLIQSLVAAALGWPEPDGRTRLYVHADNHRAQAAYRKCGFAPTGAVVDGDQGRELEFLLAR